MITIVDEDKAAVLDVPFEMFPLLRRKLHQLMATQVTERAFEQVRTAQLHHFFLLINGQRRVFHQRMQDVDRHPLIGVPIAGGILNAGEDEGFQ